MRRLLVLLLGLCTVTVSAVPRTGDSPWRVYLEFDQMLVLKVGAEFSVTPDWGIKGGAGFTLLNPTTIGYELLGVYHARDPGEKLQIDVEFGLPVAYFNAFEGTVVDWDEYVDDPFAGWCPGASVVWGYRFANGDVLGLETGVIAIFEYQRDSGWKDSTLPVLPNVSLRWLF